MSKSTGIEKFSFRYLVLKKYVDITFRLFYRVKYHGREHVDLNQVLIFAANHQNGLMDALAVLTSFGWQPVFLGRSDIFKSPVMAKILTFLKILPVYRIRDGYSELQKNDETFLQTIEILKNKNGLTIFPEGNHEGRRRLRPLKKGIGRIAFQAMLHSEHNHDIQIVPVGLNYQNYHKTGSKLLVRFGEPIAVAAYKDDFINNPAQAYTRLLANLEARITESTIHIDNTEEYETIEFCADVAAAWTFALTRNMQKSFTTQQRAVTNIEKLIAEKPDEYQALKKQTYLLQELLHKNNIDVSESGYLHKSSGSTWLSASIATALFPFFVYGWINNILPTLITTHFSSKTKDPQFESSIRYVMAIVFYPLFWILQSCFFYLFTTNYVLAFLYLVSLPVSLLVKRRWVSNYHCLRIRLLSRKSISDIQELIFSILKKSGITLL